MIIFKSINSLNKYIKLNNNIGFVPTMGSLHKGHISLIKKSLKISNKTLVSLFVNPYQFNKKQDFNKYPRNLQSDIKLLKKLKVNYILIPRVSDIFEKTSIKSIDIEPKDKILCAKYRPGHFEGVLAVINQFLLKIKVGKIFLGEKDYQQLYLIKKLVKKKFKTKVISCKTIRYKNTYAYSSRNNLLNPKKLKILIKVADILKKYKYILKKSIINIHKNTTIIKNITNLGVKIEYLEVRNYKLGKKISKKNFKVFIAYYIDGIRFIDNF